MHILALIFVNDWESCILSKYVDGHCSSHKITYVVEVVEGGRGSVQRRHIKMTTTL
jgi:hypothetical protein